jgi:hypothetical protein
MTKPGYQPDNVHVGGVVIFVVLLAFGCAVTAVLLWKTQVKLVPEGRPPLVQAQPLEQPLQPSAEHPLSPAEDMRAMRLRQERTLKSYSAIPGDSAHARVPIDRAIDLLLQSGELQKPFVIPSTRPFEAPTQPSPWALPPVRNRT